MNASDVAALRVLLGREDVIEAAAVAEWDLAHEGMPSHRVPWREAFPAAQESFRAGARAAFAAVLELAGALPVDDDDSLRDTHVPVPGAEQCDGWQCGRGPDRRAS